MLFQTSLASQVNPLLQNPSLQSQILNGVNLGSGVVNTVNHMLGRKLQGWRIIGINAQATIWDSQSTNTTPDVTLLLNTSAPVQVNLEVF